MIGRPDPSHPQPRRGRALPPRSAEAAPPGPDPAPVLPAGDAEVDAEVIVATEAGGWAGAGFDPEALARNAALLTLASCGGLAASPIIDITLTDDAEQQGLNRTYRGKDVPTNVLAFAGADPGGNRPPGMPLLLGDIVLAWTTICREAGEQDKPLADHFTHLVVHGVLHLLGYDHQTPAEAAAMETQEIAILGKLGVPDPYRDTI